MADNYLEKKMEEYRRGAPKPPMRRSPLGNKPHTAVMPCDLRGAFVIGSERLSNILTACGRALRDTSCRTACCASDRVEGAKVAQAYGLQYYPVNGNDEPALAEAMEKASAAFGSLDVVVRERHGGLSVTVNGLESSILRSADCPDDVFEKAGSRLLVYLCLPQSIDLKTCGNFTIDADGHVGIQR